MMIDIFTGEELIRFVENYPWYKKDKFDPNTLHPFDKVLVRNSDDSRWRCSLYSYAIENEKATRYVTIDYSYRYRCCIPYNEDTKHLAGTDKDAPKFYRYWED